MHLIYRYLCPLLLVLCPHFAHAAKHDLKLVRSEAIDLTWAGNFVHYDLLIRGEHSFIGYYDAQRQLTIAHRFRNQPWVYYKVDSYFGYDSHNYIEMELDDNGILHVLANMHNHRLEYFRTEWPYTVRSLRRIPVMANPELEKGMTYPVFLRDQASNLIVKYRDGSSGNGVEIYNRYDLNTQTWTPLHRKPLLDGEGLMNAYPAGPALGPDGLFHLIWVWRDTPDAATNHTLSYARSSDLIHWESAAGAPIELPITIRKGDVIDPVPPFSGIINGGARLGFDQENRPIVAYHKFDENGWTQVYLARAIDGKWVSQKVTTWEGFRWEFSGTGSLPTFELRILDVRSTDEGTLEVDVKKLGASLRLEVDATSLALLGEEPFDPYPKVLNRFASSPEVILDGGETVGEERIFRTLSTSNGAFHYILTWEAQAPNRGQPREDITPPATLRLHTFELSNNPEIAQ